LPDGSIAKKEVGATGVPAPEVVDMGDGTVGGMRRVLIMHGGQKLAEFAIE